MHQFTGKVIMILIIVSFCLGLLVVGDILPRSWIGLKQEYTRENNTNSNSNYYPSVKVSSTYDKKIEAKEEIGDQGY